MYQGWYFRFSLWYYFNCLHMYPMDQDKEQEIHNDVTYRMIPCN